MPQTSTQLGQLSPVAIIFFLLFIGVTLGITYWAARQTKTTSEFYAAGGGISGFQNGLALAGDFMSAASFLGIAGLVATGGYNGLIYSVGYLVGWPVVMFLIAEPLRNLGKYTFADVVAYRLQQKPIKTMAAIGSIVTVIFYLTAQMVGAGGLIKLMFNLPYETALLAVGVLMIAYVTFGGMLATTWVQIIKAILLIAGATILTGLVLNRFGWSYNNLFGAVAQLPNGAALLRPGNTDAIATSPLDLISLALGLMFGTAGLPHILMRFYTVPDAREARKSVFVATGFIGYFYILTFTIGLRRGGFGQRELAQKRGRRRLQQQHGGAIIGRNFGRRAVSGLFDRRRFRHDFGGRGRFDVGGRERDFARFICGRVARGRFGRKKRSARRQNRHGRIGHYRHHHGIFVQGRQRGFHGWPGVRGRGLGQFPGAFDVGAVAQTHHAGRRRQHGHRFGQRRRLDYPIANGVERRVPHEFAAAGFAEEPDHYLDVTGLCRWHPGLNVYPRRNGVQQVRGTTGALVSRR